MGDVLFNDCRVLDGTGAPAYPAAVTVRGDRVVHIARDEGRVAAAPAAGPKALVIDCHGLCLAPGFIDPHTHSDFTLLADPRAESRVRQGVTTEVVGNCGSSAAPLAGEAVAEAAAEAAGVGVQVDWTDMAGYLERLRRGGTAVNVVTLVGHNTVRGCVLGFDDVPPSAADLEQMECVVAQAVAQGARGLSSGLFYPPGSYAGADEVARLARTAGVAARSARLQGAEGTAVYASHIRDEAAGILQAVEEAVSIGERAGTPVEVSHVKLSGPRAHSLLAQLLESIDAAQQRAVPVGFDLYPYVASGTWLIAMLPYAYQQGGAAAVAHRVADADVRAELHADLLADPVGWQERTGVARWEGIVVGRCPGDAAAEGQSIADLASLRGLHPLDVALDLIVVSEGQADATWFDQSESVVRALIAHPAVAIGSDGESLAPDGPLADIPAHPRAYGTFPRVLARYVRQTAVITLEDAVRKMTSLTAMRLGLRDRGVIREGAFADLVLFDPVTIVDRATFARPAVYPTGIHCVMINGVLVFKDGERTAALPGRVL